jgi:hypothetical protein
MFLTAIDFFDTAAGGALVNRSFRIDQIKTGYLQQRYKPVEDKLQPQSPAPKPRPSA